jgi:hypothetical protein
VKCNRSTQTAKVKIQQHGAQVEHCSTGVEASNTSIETLFDHFRCPRELLNFRFGGERSSAPGFFHFGPGTVCYGRSALGPLAKETDSRLCDARRSISFEGTQILLPFDPDEIVDNLRLERYPGCRLGQLEQALKSAYYCLRPLTNRRLRSLMQSFRSTGWQKKAFPRWPVDTSVEDIFNQLLKLVLQASGEERIPFIWFWPRGAQACVSLTHDVETSAGRDFCSELMDLDESFGIKASFQVVPEDRYTMSGNYLSEFRERGFEICVQDLNHDGRLFDDFGEFSRRADLINRYGQEFGAKGFRSAVLYRNLEWFRHLDFSFDMSVPNVGHLDPQQGGCCTVFPYSVGRLMEVPVTTTQDYSLFHILNQRTVDLWKRQFEMILAQNGLATFLVHPDYIIDRETQSVYTSLLEMLSVARTKELLWFALPGEIDEWWRARNSMSVVKAGNSWRIEGEGAERATLAFARYVDGQLVYELATADEKHGHTTRDQETRALPRVLV